MSVIVPSIWKVLRLIAVRNSPSHYVPDQFFCIWCIVDHSTYLGLGTEFRSEKIPRNRLGTISVIPRKKALIPRHSEFRGRANSEARNGTNSAEKTSFTKQHQNNLTKWCWFLFHGMVQTAFREFISIFYCMENNSELCSLPRNSSERNSENLHLFWFHGKVIPYLQCQPTKCITNNT